MGGCPVVPLVPLVLGICFGWCATLVAGCTTIAAGKRATADGSTMCAHSNDGDGDTAGNLMTVPPATWSPNTRRNVSGGDIPQVPSTVGYFTKPGGYASTNEYQVRPCRCRARAHHLALLESPESFRSDSVWCLCPCPASKPSAGRRSGMQMPVHDSARPWANAQCPVSQPSAVPMGGLDSRRLLLSRQLTPCGGWIMGGAVWNMGLLRLDSRRARATRDSREIVRLEPS